MDWRLTWNFRIDFTVLEEYVTKPIRVHHRKT